MVKVKHRTRRDGGIKVRDTWYELDASGCVDVSEAHAALLAQGSMWTRIASGAKPPPPPPPPPPSPPVSPPATTLDPEPEPAPPKPDIDLQAMERSELLGLARSLGIEVDGRWGKLKLATMIRRARKKG